LRFEPTGPRAQFSFRGATDVDGDGADEMVAGYSRPDARQAMVPFVLDWDESRNRYALARSISDPRGSPTRSWRASSSSLRVSAGPSMHARSRFATVAAPSFAGVASRTS
jgi:hypothetical protein